MAIRPANVLTIAPGVPFLSTFAQALLDGRVLPGLSRASGAFALARATVFVPTQRARRALVAALADAAGGSTLLPRVAALGALDEENAADMDDALPGAADVPPAVGPLERRLALTRLVRTWAGRLRGAIVSADPLTGLTVDESRALLVGTTTADAFALAGDLGDLLDEFIIEGIETARMRDLGGSEHDPYWQITAQFLQIAFEYWPKELAARGCIDAAHRRVRLADIETARLRESGAAAPTIVLGSTGTNEATARLMAAICRLPNGAVVLPGLDTHCSDVVFASIGRSGEAAEEPAYGHPQAALKRLFAILGIERRDVGELAPAGMTDRVKLVSEALRPAETTHEWPQIRSALGPALPSALGDVDLLEAADEREEALAIAIRLRETLECPGRTAALVTPDRALARRVRNELTRWSITADDSAGEPLATFPPGIFARLILRAVEDGTDAALLALLSHPLARFGHDPNEITRLVRLLEVGVFRAGPPIGATPAERVAAARGLDSNLAARTISERQWQAMTALLTAADKALASLRALEDAPLSTWVRVHGETVAACSVALDGEEGAHLLALLQDPPLIGSDLPVRRGEYGALFDRFAQARVVPGPHDAHPRLKILGLLEARLLFADLVVFAGLDEAVWPPLARNSPFLNRPMRAALGLTPPERRIGQTAHDFWMGMGAPAVLLTRAKKRGGSPTTASRFLQRLSTLAGDAMTPARVRGDRLAELARSLDRPQSFRPVPMPQPKPPVRLRPIRLSVTRIERWIRDPYSIYAERILKLTPLGSLDAVPGFAEQGTAVHAAIDWATREFGVATEPADADARLVAKADELLAALHEDASWRTFRRPRIMAGLAYFLAYHRSRQPLLSAVHPERRGQLPLALDDGTTFTLTGTADRIEIDRDGNVRLVDFKTGSPPSSAEIAADLAPQLTLEAAMIAAGGFPDLAPRAIAEALYIKLGGKTGGKDVELKFRDESLGEVVTRHHALLLDLANNYRNPDQGYASRPVAKWAMRYSDYDHLARVKEWTATSGLAADYT